MLPAALAEAAETSGTTMTVIVLGAAVGVGIGIAGAVFGVRRGLKDARNEAEKRAIVQGTWLIGIFVLLFLAGMLLIDNERRWWLWPPYGVGLALLIRHVNQKQMAARATSESAGGADSPASDQ